MTTVETILDHAGGFGKAQLLVTIIYMCFVIPIEWNFMLLAFAATVPNWQCVTPEGFNSTSLFGNISTFKVCYINDEPCTEFLFEQWPRTMVNEWSLVCDLRWVKATVISLQMAGVMVGSIMAGYIGDHYGRRHTLLGFGLLYTSSTLYTAFSISWQMFASGRLLIGASIGGMVVVLYPYCVEFIPTRRRSVLLLLPGYVLGYNLLGLGAYFLEDWSQLHLINAVMSVLPILVAYLMMPESIRWLAVKNRIDEAVQACEKIAAFNGKTVPCNTRDIFESIAANNLLQRGKKRYTYLDLVKDKYLLKLTVIICYHWIAMNLVFYGISYAVSSLSGNFTLNVFFMTIPDLPLLVVTFNLIERIGRRKTVMIIFSICSLASLGCVIVQLAVPASSRDVWINVMAFTARIAACLGYCVVIMWGVELYPTVTRNLGYGAHSAAARIGSMLAPFVVDLERNAVLAFAVCSAATLVVVLSSIALPETSNVELPDTLHQTKGIKVENEQNDKDDMDDVPLKSSPPYNVEEIVEEDKKIPV